MEHPRPEDAPLVPTSTGVPAVPEPDLKARRWRLIGQVAVFQGKLVLDGLKDLVLGPLALVIAGIGLVFDREDPGRRFRALLRSGQRFDRWVNLFGEGAEASARIPEGTPADTEHPVLRGTRAEGLDAYVARVEAVLSDQVRRGGLTARAKDAIDQALDAVERKPPH